MIQRKKLGKIIEQEKKTFFSKKDSPGGGGETETLKENLVRSMRKDRKPTKKRSGGGAKKRKEEKHSSSRERSGKGLLPEIGKEFSRFWGEKGRFRGKRPGIVRRGMYVPVSQLRGLSTLREPPEEDS